MKMERNNENEKTTKDDNGQAVDEQICVLKQWKLNESGRAGDDASRSYEIRK